MSQSSSCSGSCQSCGQSAGCGQKPEDRIQRKIIVMSGKGGVGKSTVSVNLALALSLTGRRVGLLDVDLHGPSVPHMLHLQNEKLCTEGERLLPAQIGNLKVMSIGFLLETPDSAVIWRGPAKAGVIRQFINEVAWGELDDLVIDCPPGTGDEVLSVCQELKNVTGAVIVTTPQQVAAVDVSKSLNFCNQIGLPVLGIVENMSGFVCPHCHQTTEIFSAGAGVRLAGQYQVPLLGRIPVDPTICQSGDDGKPFAFYQTGGPTADAFAAIVDQIDGQTK